MSGFDHVNRGDPAGDAVSDGAVARNIVATRHHLDLGSDLASSGCGRAALRDLLDEPGWSALRTDEAALVATELIPNAVTHGDALIEVIVEVLDDEVCVPLANCFARRPELRTADIDGGRGLLLVSVLAGRGVSTPPPPERRSTSGSHSTDREVAHD